MEIVLINLARGQRDRIWRDGREYIRAPITSIVPGVLNGSKGALLYTPDDCRNSVKSWDGIPLTYFHPTRNGVNVSAHERGVKDQHWIGHVENTTFNGKLRKFGMFDVQWTRKLDQKYGGDVLNKLESGEPIEMSTGLFTDNEDTAGEYNGRRFDAIARNYRPDHVAVLPGQVGACSVNDGCGVNVNELVENVWSDEARAASLAARQANAKDALGHGSDARVSVHDSSGKAVSVHGSHKEAREAAIKKIKETGKFHHTEESGGEHEGEMAWQPYHNTGTKAQFEKEHGVKVNALSSAYRGAGERAPNALLDLGEEAIGEVHDAGPDQAPTSVFTGDMPEPDEGGDMDMAERGGLIARVTHAVVSLLTGNATYSQDKKMKGYGITGKQVHDAAVAGASPAARANLIGDKAPQDGGRDADELEKDDNELPAYDAHPGNERGNAGEAGLTGKKTSQSGGGTAPKAPDIDDNCSTYMKPTKKSPATNSETDMADVLKLEGLSASERAAKLTELRPKMIKYLTTNCGCADEKKAFPLLNNETLAVLTVNKQKIAANVKPDSSNADASGSGAFSNAIDAGRDDGDSGDGAETDKDEDDYLKGKKQDPNRSIAQVPPLKNQRRLTRDEWMRIAPPEIQEATTNMLRREDGQKKQIAARLTQHVRDDAQRKRLVANLLRKSLAELEDEMVLHARPEVAVQDPFDGTRRASYLGAAGGPGDFQINRRDDDSKDDVLEQLTVNLGMPVDKFNEAVDAFARGAA